MNIQLRIYLAKNKKDISLGDTIAPPIDLYNRDLYDSNFENLFCVCI